ncbi:MAG: alpha/beta hydrolase [Polyangiaceae bacterium]|nr:alpha/beta hydrolase [Polyangiaceae bacterium]
MCHAILVRVVTFASLIVALSACNGRRDSPGAAIPSPSAAPIASTALIASASTASTPKLAPKSDASPRAPARVERLPVHGDLPVSVVLSPSNTAPTTIFLHGICANGAAYLQTFPEAARAHGGILAMDGDRPCGSTNEYRSFTWDAARQHERIEAALIAAGLDVIPPGGLTVVGYSQGASIAEQLAARWPDRYARIVLIGAPTDPSPAHFRQARGLVTMSCSLDVTSRMREAARKTDAAGTPATFFEMPGCTHGNVADAERIFGDALTWLDEHSKPIPDGARAVALKK